MPLSSVSLLCGEDVEGDHNDNYDMGGHALFYYGI